MLESFVYSSTTRLWDELILFEGIAEKYESTKLRDDIRLFPVLKDDKIVGSHMLKYKGTDL